MELGPLISVIIPMYNVEKYVEATILSVMEQTYKNIEVLIIDDGSTDNSEEIVKKMMRKYNNIIYVNQENSGVAHARNTGIRLSRGEFIAFIDSDDLWSKDKLEKQCNTLMNSNYKACYCGTLDFYENSVIYIKEKNKYYSGDVLIKFLKGYFWGQTGTWLIDRNLIIENELYFTVDCNWGEDFEFFFKIMALGKVTYVDEDLFIYRKRELSLSKYSLSKLKEIDVWNRLIEWSKSYEKKIQYNVNEIIDIIMKFRIPSAVIRILFEGQRTNFIERNSVKLDNRFIEKNQDLEKYVDRFSPFIGSPVLSCKILYYKFSISSKSLFFIYNCANTMRFLLRKIF